MKKNPKKDKLLLKTATTKSLSIALSTINPALGIAWELTTSLIGSAVELRKERAIEWVNNIVENPQVFRSELIQSKEFQDGFVFSLEQYLRLRSAEKRAGARKIFIDFTSSPNKAEYPLERYFDTLSKISSSGLWLLAFLKFRIVPLKEKAVKKKLKVNNLGNEKPLEWWFQNYMQSERLSEHFSIWLHEEFNPNSEKVREKYNHGNTIHQPLLGEVFDKESEARSAYYYPVAELQYLGLLGQSVSGGGIGEGVGMSWDFTDFAYEFIKFLSDEGLVDYPPDLQL